MNGFLRCQLILKPIDEYDAFRNLPDLLVDVDLSAFVPGSFGRFENYCHAIYTNDVISVLINMSIKSL